MHLVIVNCSPRTVSESNTNIIVEAFARGYTQRGNTAEIHHLSQKGTWDDIRTAFYANDNILMALPLYVESVPGIMMEFLETLTPKRDVPGGKRTKLAFLLQGGFAEASQLRCGERYLEKLPSYLNCDHNGTLIKGNMFVLHMMPPQSREKITAPFVEMGRHFAEDESFQKAVTEAFAGPEYFSKAMIAFFTLITPLRKLFFHQFFKSKGCKGSLRAKPYETNPT